VLFRSQPIAGLSIRPCAIAQGACVDRNIAAYSSDQVVQYYKDRNDPLDLPETVILTLLRDTLAGSRMLDIGVGGGRTTAHFAELAETYVGIDYVESLARVCQQKFPSLTFYAADARDLSRFAEASFGFVLFSCNGIDYVTADEERNRVLTEVWRVLQPGGYFAFATHNLNTVRTWGRVQFSLNPVRAAVASYVNVRRQRVNDLACAEEADHMVLNDGAHHWKLDTFYVRPRAQVRTLEALGYERIRIFDLGGREVPRDRLDQNTDGWLHYLCARPVSV